MDTYRFVLEFFTFFEASIQISEKILQIRLNPQNSHYFSLKHDLGQEAFHLAFDTTCLPEAPEAGALQGNATSLELISVGHPLLDRMHRYLRKQGQRCVMVLPKRKNSTKKMARLSLNLPSSFSYALTQRREWKEAYYFQFKNHYFSGDSSREELMEAGIRSDFQPLPPYPDFLFMEGKILGRWKAPQHFPLLYEQALGLIRERVKIQATHQERLLWTELQRGATRLENYYFHHIADISNKDFLVQDQRISELQKELKQHRETLAQKYQLEVHIELLRYLVLRFPVQIFKLESALGIFQLTFNGSLGEWEWFLCTRCQQKRTALWCDEKGGFDPSVPCLPCLQKQHESKV